MTANDLRQYVVDTACSYLGCSEYDGSHRAIIDLYNTLSPLPRGYKVKYDDEWCATYVSAVAVKCGLTDIIPPECGCEQMIERFKSLGRWQEDDSTTPDKGDIIFYDWQDSGIGDDTGWADHVGIIVNVDGDTIKVVEGNISGKVWYRYLYINDKYIRGYGKPDYAKEATTMDDFGVDISNHNKIDDYAAFSDAINYAILKLTEGTFFFDGKFEQHYNELHGRGVPIGVYVYTHAETAEAGKAEAEYALAHLAGRALELPIYLDIEGEVIKAGRNKVMAGALAFGEVIKAAGHRWGVYASESKYGTTLDTDALRKAGASIWIANYSAKPRIDCDIWQYSADSKVAGAAGIIDHDSMIHNVIIDNTAKAAETASDWARESCTKAVRAGVFHGDGNGYRWQDSITREELAVVLDNLRLLG